VTPVVQVIQGMCVVTRDQGFEVLLGAYEKFRKATVSYVMSVRPFAIPRCSSSTPTGRIFRENFVYVVGGYRSLPRKLKLLKIGLGLGGGGQVGYIFFLF